MEELAAGLKTEGAKERGLPVLPISRTVPSLSLPVCLPVSGSASPTLFFNACRPFSFSNRSAVTLLSVCISHAASPLHGQGGG